MKSLSLLRSFVWRDILHNRIGSLLTICGIALGVAVMVAIDLANATALNRFEESIDFIAGKSNLEVHPIAGATMDESVLYRLQWLWGRGAAFTPVVDEFAVVPNKVPDVVQVLGVDMLADSAFRPFKIAEQQGGQSGVAAFDTDIFSRNTAYIGESLAHKYQLRKGEHFNVLVNDKLESLEIVGVLSMSGPARAFGGNLVLMDIGSAQQLFSLNGKISRIDIIVPESAIISIADRISKQSPPGLQVDRPQRRGAQVAKMIAAFQYNLMALSLIALLVGMFLIYNTMSMTVIRKRTEIGTLRVIGAGRALICSLFLSQSLILGTVGSALGVLLGLFFAGGAVQAVASTVQSLYVDEPPIQVSIDAHMLLIAFFVGAFLTILAGAPSLLEAMAVQPAEATRKGSYETKVRLSSGKLMILSLALLALAILAALAPPLNNFPVFGYLSASLAIFGAAFLSPAYVRSLLQVLAAPLRNFAGVEARLATGSLSGALGRTSVAVASLMVGIAMMVSLAIMIGSFRQTVMVWVQQTLKADLYVEPAARAASKRVGHLAADVVERIRKSSTVEDVDAFAEAPIEYNGQTATLGAGDLDVLIKHGLLLFIDGEPTQKVISRVIASCGCIVTESFAVKNNVRKGDVIILPTPSGRLYTHVQGIYYDYASDAGYVVITRAAFLKYFHDDRSTTLGVYLKPGIDPSSARTLILENLGQNTMLNIRTNRDLKGEVLRVFDKTFAITYALHAISITVAILSVMNALFAMAMERRTEFVILKYIGATTAQVRKMVLIEAGLLGFLGNVSGLVVGFFLSFLLIHVINKQSFGWTIQLSLPFDYLALSFALVMFCSILSGLLPASIVIRHLNPEAVRAE